MSHVYTVGLLIIFAFATMKGVYLRDNINCWVPKQFTDSFEKYAHDYCWISNTYYIPMDEPIPVDIRARESETITYYQWVPLILIFQAFMFKLPYFVWKLFNGYSGLSLEKVIHLSEQTEFDAPDSRKVTIDHLARFLEKWLNGQKEYHWNVIVRMRHRMARVCCLFCDKRAGTFLSALFLSVKFLYVINVIGQFFLLNAFMATDYNLYGFEIINHLAAKGEWRESPRFPKVTLCDFEIRQLQNIQRFTVQCVLPINMFNEKIFIFVWFWLVLVAVLSVYNLAQWLFISVFKRNRSNFVKKYLKITNDLQTAYDKKLAAKFADTFLHDDGVFILRIVTKNTSDIITTELVHLLFERYKNQVKTSNMNDVEDSFDEDAKEPLQ